MVATKAALSIWLDALYRPDEKSSAEAPMIGLEARAKLESRLRALEYRSDLNGRGERFDPALRKRQSKYEMKGGEAVRQYNTAADSVELIPTGHDPVGVAMEIVSVVKQEKKSTKEQQKKDKETAKPPPADESSDESSVEETKEERKARRAAKRAAKAAKKAAKAAKHANGDVEMSSTAAAKKDKKEKKRHREVEAANDDAMEVDGESAKKKKKKEKHRLSET